MVKKVYITRKIPQPGIDLFFENGFDVEIYDEDKPIPFETLIDKIKNVDALLPLLTDSITKQVITKGKKLKIIANYAVGFNNIDLGSATKSKIAVTNTPGVLTDATAELTWALIMSVSKRIVEADQYTREGKFNGWGPMLMMGSELSGKTLGIIGTGRIGTAVVQRAAGFDLNILYFSNSRNDIIENKFGGKKVQFDELIENSDIISLHVPLTDKTFHMIDSGNFNQMKNTAYIINTSRGQVINESALVDALMNNKIAGVGLDVYENEPEVHKDLLEFKNVVLLPHIGSATLETRTKMAIMAATNIVEFFNGNQPPNILNPEIF